MTNPVFAKYRNDNAKTTVMFAELDSHVYGQANFEVTQVRDGENASTLRLTKDDAYRMIENVKTNTGWIEYE